MKHPYKMIRPVWLVVSLCVSAALLAVGAVANALRLRFWQELTLQNRVAVPLLIALFGLLFVVAVAFLCVSRYEIKKGALYVRYGLIAMKFPLKEITEAVKREKSKKLLLFFGEKGFISVQIRFESVSAFLDALKAAGGDFSYSIDYEDVEMP